MTKRIIFTPTRAQAHIIEGYRKAYRLNKPQDVFSTGLALLEKAEKVRAYNQLASQMQADLSPDQEAAEARKEHVYGEQSARESKVWPPHSPPPSGQDGSAE